MYGWEYVGLYVCVWLNVCVLVCVWMCACMLAIYAPIFLSRQPGPLLRHFITSFQLLWSRTVNRVFLPQSVSLS